MFRVKAQRHPQKKEIYTILKFLNMQMERLGIDVASSLSPDMNFCHPEGDLKEKGWKVLMLQEN